MEQEEDSRDKLLGSSKEQKLLFHLRSQSAADVRNTILQLNREKYVVENARNNYLRLFLKGLLWMAVLLLSFWYFEIDYLGNILAFLFLLGSTFGMAVPMILIYQANLELERLRVRIKYAEEKTHYSIIPDGEEDEKVSDRLLSSIRNFIN